MNLRSQLVLVMLLAATWPAGTVMVAAQESGLNPLRIELNGVVAGADGRAAIFKAAADSGMAPVNFMLAEGQEKFGIELLSVEAGLNRVVIRNRGREETLVICGTPRLLALTSTNGTVVNWAIPAAAASAAVSGVPSPVNSGGPAHGGDASVHGRATIAGEKAGEEKTSDLNHAAGGASEVTVTPGNGTDSPDSPSVAQGPQLYQWWVKEAEKIERARVETAARVMSGEWQPYPLTPLTPVGTPPQLIGTDSAFMDHGPGVLLGHN